MSLCCIDSTGYSAHLITNELHVKICIMKEILSWAWERKAIIIIFTPTLSDFAHGFVFRYFAPCVCHCVSFDSLPDSNMQSGQSVMKLDQDGAPSVVFVPCTKKTLIFYRFQNFKVSVNLKCMTYDILVRNTHF